MKTYSYDVHTPEHEDALYNFMQDLRYAGWGRMFAGDTTLWSVSRASLLDDSAELHHVSVALRFKWKVILKEWHSLISRSLTDWGFRPRRQLVLLYAEIMKYLVEDEKFNKKMSFLHRRFFMNLDGSFILLFGAVWCEMKASPQRQQKPHLFHFKHSLHLTPPQIGLAYHVLSNFVVCPGRCKTFVVVPRLTSAEFNLRHSYKMFSATKQFCFGCVIDSADWFRHHVPAQIRLRFIIIGMKSDARIN